MAEHMGQFRHGAEEGEDGIAGRLLPGERERFAQAMKNLSDRLKKRDTLGLPPGTPKEEINAAWAAKKAELGVPADADDKVVLKAIEAQAAKQTKGRGRKKK